MQKIGIIFFCLVFIFPKLLISQVPELIFDRFKVDQGNSPQDISNMCQDNIGFLWIGSDNGVDKFDGYSFYNYRSSISNTNSICNNAVGHVFFDSFGKLWIASQEGLNKFSIADDRFVHYFHDPLDSTSIGDNVISPFFEDKNRTLWIGTYGGLCRYNREKGNFTTFSHNPNNPNSISHNTISCIYQDKNGDYWIGTWGGGLNKLNAKTGKFKVYKHDPENPKSISHNFIRNILIDKSGNFWVGTTGGGLNQFNPVDETFKHYKNDPLNPKSLSDDFITSIFEDEFGNIWMGTFNGGLNIFDVKNKEFTRFNFNQNNPNGILSDCVTSILKDKNGNIFIGTSRGLNKVRFKKNIFKFYTKTNGKKGECLSDMLARSICEDRDGNIWIGTYEGGLNKLYKKTGRFSYYTLDFKESLMTNKTEVTGIIENEDGSFWISTVGNGLFKFFKDGKHINYTHNFFETNSKYKSTFLLKDKKGLVWIGYPNGVICIFNPKTEKFSQIKLGSSGIDKAYVDEINYIIEDQYENKWIAVRHGGVYKIDASTDKITKLPAETPDKNSLSDRDAKVLCLGDNDILWIGTTNGFNRYDIKRKTFKHYFIKDGLPDNVIRSITKDKKGNLWLGTHQGLSRFDPATERFNNYDERDGVFISQFFGNSFYSQRTGEMYLCGYNGFIHFNPDKIEVDATMPKIYISDLEIHGKMVGVREKILGSIVLDKSILITRKINLNYKQNNFAIHFISLHYKMPDKNQYAYKLDGYDKNWHFSGKERVAKYMNLASGTYTFRVIGSNSDGLWNKKGAALVINISPPWWQTLWMIILYIIFIAGSVVLYIHFRSLKHKKDNILLQKLVAHRTEEVEAQNDQLAKQADKLKEMSQMRSRFYTYLSHEFRTPLTMIMGPLQQILSSTKKINTEEYHKLMMQNSKKLLYLIDELLDLSKLEKGSMELKATFNKLNPFINRIVLSFSNIAERKQIALKFIENDEDIKCFFNREKFEKVIINLISNAFKYTQPGGEILVSVSTIYPSNTNQSYDNKKYAEGIVEIIVKDDGIGIGPDKLPNIFEQFFQGKDSDTIERKGWGVGLALVKELVELHKGEIKVQSKLNEGTEFKVILPIGKKHLSENEILINEDFESNNFRFSNPNIEIQTNHYNVQAELYEDDNSQIAIPEDSKDSKSNFHKKYSVLIVEDNSEIRGYIRQILNNDYKVLEAANGREGIYKGLETIPDLIISDIMMPEVDGYELCRKLKTEFSTCHIPIILLTAKSSDVEKIEGLEKGADDYLIKPFNPVELVKRVENLIELRQQLQRKYKQEILLAPGKVTVKSMDEKFLEKVKNIIDENIAIEDLSVEMLYTEVGMSRSNFHSKFRALTGHSANQFIRSYRLNRAVQLMEQNAGNISDIAYSVGFSSTAYFTKCFKVEFDKLPSEYFKI